MYRRTQQDIPSPAFQPFLHRTEDGRNERVSRLREANYTSRPLSLTFSRRQALALSPIAGREDKKYGTHARNVDDSAPSPNSFSPLGEKAGKRGSPHSGESTEANP